MLATWGCTTFPKPTLSLDFLGATSLDSGITFSRGSQATLFDSTGTLRYAKHNLLLQSQDFATTWTASNTSVSANSVTAPDGTNTADTLTGAAGSGLLKRIFQSFTMPAEACTFSVFAKAGTHNFIQFFYSGAGATTYANFDISTGTAGDFNGVSSSITAVGNGWYRCTHTFVPNNTSANISLVDSNTAARGATTSTTNNVYLWGAQFNITNMEGGVTSSLTTYYPTTTAAYYAPRFDYNPSTLQPRGLLIEEQRTNLIRNSTGVGAVAGTPGTAPTNWVVGSSATHASSIIGTGVENGINYVDIQYVVSAGAVAASLIYADTPAATASTAYTGSYFLKLVSGSIPQVRFIWQDGITTVARSFFSITSSLTRYDNTYTTSVGATLARFVIGIDASAAGTTFVIRVGLPQTEQGAFATSVIPTTTTALTRNADVASMTGTNFSSWYNQTEGTFFAQASSAWASGNVVGSSDNTNSNRVFVGIASGPVSRLLITTLGSAQAAVTVAYTLNTVAKFAGAYKLNSSNFASNGTLGIEDTVCTIPTVDRLSIGTNTTATDFFLNGWISRIAYYPTRLPNATLQALTA